MVRSVLGEVGFQDLAWRVLDSRYFGVPQRRRRVFILARRGGGRHAAEILLEPEGGGGDFEASEEARARSSLLAESGVVQALDRKGGGADDNEAQAGHLIAGTVRSHVRPGSNDWGGIIGPEVAAPLTKGSAVGEGVSVPGRRQEDDWNLVGASPDPDRVREASGIPGRVDVGAFNLRGRDEGAQAEPDDLASLRASSGGSSRSYIYGDAEPRDRCAFDPLPDFPRYAACGDAVTVNVAEWIGNRLRERAQEEGSK